jgi:hypothetical protein
LDEGRQTARGADSLSAAHDDSIGTDCQRIALVLRNFSHGEIPIGAGSASRVGATPSSIQMEDVVGRRALRGLMRFELETSAAGNVLAEAINDRLECRFTILDTNATLDSKLPSVGYNVEGCRDHLIIGG